MSAACEDTRQWVPVNTVTQHAFYPNTPLDFSPQCGARTSMNGTDCLALYLGLLSQLFFCSRFFPHGCEKSCERRPWYKATGCPCAYLIQSESGSFLSVLLNSSPSLVSLRRRCRIVSAVTGWRQPKKMHAHHVSSGVMRWMNPVATPVVIKQ